MRCDSFRNIIVYEKLTEILVSFFCKNIVKCRVVWFLTKIRAKEKYSQKTTFSQSSAKIA